jgi:protein SCO1/2
MFALAFVSCNAKKETETAMLPFYNTAQFDAEWISESDPSYATIHTIAPFSLANQVGHVITQDSLDGNVYVANFFFTACNGICPTMVSNLRVLQDRFLNNPHVKLVSFSVMPWVDSVSVLKEYSDEHHINSNKWYLLTGDREEIYTLGRQSYFAEKTLGTTKNADEFLHTESMLLIDAKRRIRGIYNATQRVDIERVTEDIQTLLSD